jgi:hypothetical protein
MEKIISRELSSQLQEQRIGLHRVGRLSSLIRSATKVSTAGGFDQACVFLQKRRGQDEIAEQFRRMRWVLILQEILEDPTACRDVLSGDPPTRFCGEKSKRLGDILGLTDTIEGRRSCGDRPIALWQQLRVGVARRNGIHCDTALTDLTCKHSYELLHGGLATEIQRSLSHQHLRAAGGGGNNTAAFAHPACSFLKRHERALRVDGEDVIEIRFGEFNHRSNSGDGCVRNHDIEPTKRILRQIEQRADVPCAVAYLFASPRRKIYLRPSGSFRLFKIQAYVGSGAGIPKPALCVCLGYPMGQLQFAGN